MFSKKNPHDPVDPQKEKDKNVINECIKYNPKFVEECVKYAYLSGYAGSDGIKFVDVPEHIINPVELWDIRRLIGKIEEIKLFSDTLPALQHVKRGRHWAEPLQ